MHIRIENIFTLKNSSCILETDAKKYTTENKPLLIKNPQFFSNLKETCSKLPEHAWVILT